MNKKNIDLGITPNDKLFMNYQERANARKPKVDETPLAELFPFKDHPFKIVDDEGGGFGDEN